MIGTKDLGVDFCDIDEGKLKEVAAETPVRDSSCCNCNQFQSCEFFYLIKITEEEKEKMENVEDDFSQVIKKEMKHLQEVFLERKFFSDNLYTIPKKPKSVFFFRESVVFPSKKTHFELNNEELLMIIKYIELMNQTSLFLQTIVVHTYVLDLVYISFINL